MAMEVLPDDQLTLSPANGEHGVDGQNSCLQRNADRLSVNDSGSLILNRPVILLLDLSFSVDGCAQGIDNSSQESLAYRDTCLSLGSGHLRALTDTLVTSE